MIRQLLLRFVLFACVSLSLILGACDTPSQQEAKVSTEVGALAPDFSLKDVSGRTVTLSDFRGKVVLVNFWATWCPPCKAEMPSMEQLYRELKDEGLVLLAVNTEPNGPKTVPPFLKENPHSFPVLYDDQGTVQKLYGVYKFPETFIVRTDGTIDERVIGAIDWYHPSAVEHFKALLKGEPNG